ncbi:hypothetical protein [Bacillus toyonensis]|uniref:hypothetical protein n=1 Tax=Bacillus toyonensis TaxID=155322 RepID=UPI0015CF2278|nr:hypothetical protein [Bacillus toyonensis]
MKRFLNTLLQFVVLSIVLHLLFDIVIVGWLVFNAPIKNNLIGYVHVPRQIFSKVHFKLTKKENTSLVNDEVFSFFYYCIIKIIFCL